MKKLTILFLLISSYSFAQECGKFFKIQDKSTKHPIREVTFIQGKNRVKAYADNGIYPLTFQCADTLIVDANNYYRKRYYIKNVSKDTIVVELNAVSYNLDAVVVKAMTPERLKQQLVDSVLADIARNKSIIDLPTPDRLAYEKEQVKTNSHGYGQVSLKGLLPKEAQHPITAISNIVNRKKIARIEQTQYFAKNLEVFREKYNKEKISLWTGFTGEKLTKFMDFCKLDFNFVVESLETQIVESVQQCVKNFKEK